MKISVNSVNIVRTRYWTENQLVYVTSEIFEYKFEATGSGLQIEGIFTSQDELTPSQAEKRIEELISEEFGKCKSDDHRR